MATGDWDGRTDKAKAWDDMKAALESRTIAFPDGPMIIHDTTPVGVGDAFARRYFDLPPQLPRRLSELADHQKDWAIGVDFAEAEDRVMAFIATGDPDPLAAVDDRRFLVVQPETVRAHKLAVGNRHERRRQAKKLKRGG